MNKKNEKQFNLYIEPEIQKLAREQAAELSLKPSEYTSMLYKLNLAKLVKKAVEKEKTMPIVKNKEFPTVRVSSTLNEETEKCAGKVQENKSEYIRRAVEMRNEKVRKSEK